MKFEYEVPELTEIGSFEEITQANNGNSYIDASFPSGTPNSQLTFS
jgi:hypothetical protein